MSKRRFLVLHDYGMGGSWWWIHARSPREVLETFAEVEVITDPSAAARAEDWQLDDVDIDDAVMPPGLAGLRTQRDRQRGLPGFGALADRHVLYLRQDGEDEDSAVYLVQVGPDGRRIRQVEIAEDGTATKTDADDWPFNPPLVDLYDPELPDQEIDSEEFERAWQGAHWETDR